MEPNDPKLQPSVLMKERGRLFVVCLRRAHVPRSLTKSVESIVAHEPQPCAERFQVQLVFAGKIVHNVACQRLESQAT
jgi:hypothetical protein